MELPICEICVKEDILCPSCEEKLRKGEITEIDVKLSKLIYKLSEKYPGIRGISIKKTIDMGNLLVLIVGKNEIGNLIGKGGSIIKRIKKEVKRKIKVLEETENEKKLVQDVLLPARVQGINIVYMRDGTQEYKVRIPKEDMQALPADVQTIEKLLKRVTKKDMKVIFE